MELDEVSPAELIWLVVNNPAMLYSQIKGKNDKKYKVKNTK